AGLIERHGKVWLGELRPYCRSWRFVKGMTHITLQARRFLSDRFAAQAEAWFAAAWVQTVRLEKVTLLIGALAAAPHLAAVTALDLDGTDLVDEELLRLAHSWYLERLTHLNLANNRLTDAGVRRLVRSPYLGRLTWLDLRNNSLTTAGVKALLDSPLAERLTWLDLQGNPHGFRLKTTMPSGGSVRLSR